MSDTPPNDPRDSSVPSKKYPPRFNSGEFDRKTIHPNKKMAAIVMEFPNTNVVDPDSPDKEDKEEGVKAEEEKEEVGEEKVGSVKDRVRQIESLQSRHNCS